MSDTTAAVPRIRRRKPTAAEKRVFGVDVQLDEQNRPIEQGLGAPGHETVEHWEALYKADPSPEVLAAYEAAKVQREQDALDAAEEAEEEF